MPTKLENSFTVGSPRARIISMQKVSTVVSVASRRLKRPNTAR